MGNVMTLCRICEHAATDTSTGVCRDCMNAYVSRLQWLRLIGMPTLRQVAYRQVDLGEHAARSGNTGVAPIPLRMDAEQAYIDVERDLQYLAGRIGLKPVGHDDMERPRTLRDWAWILPRLILRQHDLFALDTAAGDLHALTHDCERVDGFVSRRAERRLVGVCPECASGEDPERTPVYAARGERYAVCEACGAWLDLERVRLGYLEEAGMLHITRKRANAARWLSEQSGVRVTGKMLDNWRLAGRLHPRHVEGRSPAKPKPKRRRAASQARGGPVLGVGRARAAGMR